MSQLLWQLLLTLSLVTPHRAPLLPAAAAAVVSSRAPVVSPDCPRKCGQIDIPYPFGIGDDCYWPGRDGFNVTCDNRFDPPRLYMLDTIEIISISAESSEMHIHSLPAYICYVSENNTEPNNAPESWINTTGTPFMISPTKNLFTAIGCFAVALLNGREDMTYLTGCISTCVSLEKAANNGEPCTGLGCCQTPIQSNLSYVNVRWLNNDTNSAWSYSPCNYGFVAERTWYHFNRQHLDGKGDDRFEKRYGERGIPMVLEWAIRNNGSCKVGVSGNPTAPACVDPHSYCENATQGNGGYLCKCSKGYKGNPYDPSGRGCANINECEEDEYYPCGGGATCHDTVGGYKCKCKFGLRGDGSSNDGCQPIFPGYAIAILATFSVLVVACFFIMVVKRRNQRRFFDKNGGEILKSMGINIFTEKQLKKITNGYKTSIGEGAFGKVYKGIIIDDGTRHVAVKCASVKGEALPQEEFVNEITFQFRISHANLVRLVGCCLETDVPMLVFEFVPKGSLYNVLHASNDPYVLSLQERLDIAMGSAEALSYMHSHGGHNHVHGDIKSGNILLDNDFTPKVSDFGSAKLVCVASMYSKWCVSGDMSYIDPVYIKSGRFTEKSDVYSFGVVLLELITRKKAKDGENSLPLDFVKCCKEELNGRKLYDKDILSDGGGAESLHHMECLDRVGALAVRCLKEDIDERPNMAEVLEELKQVKAIASGGSGPV